MSLAAPQETDKYQVFTEVYEGPLDLLLDLIERAELDITSVSLAQVTDQYLDYMKRIQIQSPAEVSAFVVIAAKLIQIKSYALLPLPPAAMPEGEEEDPGVALTRQLLLYKKFKDVGAFLDERNLAGYHSFLRLAPPPKIPGKLNLEGISLADLLDAAKYIFFLRNAGQPLTDVVSIPKVTIRDRIKYIVDQLKKEKTITFRSLFSRKRSKVDIVVTFLALLELIKRKLIAATQQSIFGEISIESINDLEVKDEDQLEFSD